MLNDITPPLGLYDCWIGLNFDFTAPNRQGASVAAVHLVHCGLSRMADSEYGIVFGHLSDVMLPIIPYIHGVVVIGYSPWSGVGLVLS
jgi:hypothetical protein